MTNHTAPAQKKRLILRMDDIGASTKHHERYGLTRLPIGPIRLPFPGNFLFLKSIKPFRKWGPYQEMTAAIWKDVFLALDEFKAKLTVAITGSWIEGDGTRVPFDKKFPEEAAILAEGLKAGFLEIANHGLTHCVTHDNLFRPRLFSSNRAFHREFWDWVPVSDHKEHLSRSQDILEKTFGIRPVTFVPPGNVYSQDTLQLAYDEGLRFISCTRDPGTTSPLRYIPDEHVMSFHDREIVLFGTSWLRSRLNGHPEDRFILAREYFS